MKLMFQKKVVKYVTGFKYRADMLMIKRYLTSIRYILLDVSDIEGKYELKKILK